MIGTEFKNKDLAEWTEEAVRTLFDANPKHALIAFSDDDLSWTGYYGCTNVDRLILVKAILEDNLLDYIRANAEEIRALLDIGDDE